MPSESSETVEKTDWREHEQVNRPRGILSPKERAHIFGMLDEDPKEDADAIRQREYRIRKHLRNAIIDLHFLGRRELAQRVLSDLMTEVDLEDDTENGVLHSAEAIFYLLYSVLGEPETDTSPFKWRLAGAVSDNLVRRYADEGFSVTPTVNFDVTVGDKVPLEDLKPIFNQYPEKWLLDDELYALARTGWISEEQNREYVRKMEEKDPNSQEYREKKAAAWRRRGYEVNWTDGERYRLDKTENDE